MKKLVYFTFGPNPHSEKRISPFINSDEFDVTVISNFNFNFIGARNITLFNGNHYKNKILRNFIYQLEPFLNLFRIIYYCLSLDYDVVHFQTLLYPSYIAVLFVKTPFLITFWNGDIIWSSRGRLIERIIKKYIMRVAIKNAKGIIANSLTARDILLQQKCNPQKIHIIHFPSVDFRLLDNRDRKEIRRSYNLDDNKCLILCTRSLAMLYNTDTVLKAAAILIQNNKDYRFGFAWANASQSELERHNKLIKALALNDHVINLGSLSKEKLYELYIASDIFISLSTQDSKSNSVLEAIAAELPLVLGKIPAVNELIESLDLFCYPTGCFEIGKIAEIIKKIKNEKESMKEKLAENKAKIITHYDDMGNFNKIKELLNECCLSR